MISEIAASPCAPLLFLARAAFLHDIGKMAIPEQDSSQAWPSERVAGELLFSPAEGHVTSLYSVLGFELVAADSKGIGAG
jgi:HD superfamily phosphodiesterase